MVKSPRYIEVAVALPVNGSYTYIVPEGMADISLQGKRVLVPFGQRRITGYVLGESEAENEHKDDKDIKAIIDVLDEKPLFQPSMVPFFEWISDYYMHPIGEVIKTALPGGLNLYEIINYAITDKGKTADKKQAAISEERVLSLLEKSPMSARAICREMNGNISSALLYSMEKRKLIEKKKEIKPGKTKTITESYVSLSWNCFPSGKISKSQEKLLDCLKSFGELSLKRLKEFVPGASRAVRVLEDRGYITSSRKPVYRDPFGESISPDIAPVSTMEQEKVISETGRFLGKGFAPFLLTGVTGSGKTEVYMKLASFAVTQGFSVMVLVPEIALISQMERRFRARFGECVAILHSGLSAGEKLDQWSRITDKKIPVVIGARSAIFAPLSNTGIIIVDEEHDSSYKQEGGLKYNARDLAVVRAKLENCVVLLGSATPSVQSYYNVSIKKFSELTLTKRVENRTLPEITVVDLRKSRDSRGIRRFFSEELICSMKKALANKEQVLLFLNRRGFSGFPVCGACGEAVRCKNCDISLTFHKSANAYKCHYCGFTKSSGSDCNKCGSSEIKLLGLGTEKVEAAVKSLFPDAKVERMDSDTTVRKGSTVKILKGLREKSTNVLVGTQMIAKGHDYPGITLVGIICADLSLAFPDFRAGERTFQLLAQVAGRAGRGASKGRVILQTYNPEHFTILSAKDQDFKSFYEKEILFRKELNYPPFSRMIMIRISGRDKKRTFECAKAVGEYCKALKAENKSFHKSVDILGPIESSVTRIASRFRWQILFKGNDSRALHSFVRKIMFENALKICGRDVSMSADVDPYFMM
ncbi:MAG: primosomal protein N' [Desulfobacteraceae bacterium]|nr:MAG: primosomal protein N' [Desulfobacteraceae bacterium]